ncbi:MAG TPA: hypothetical protein VGL23_00680 [Chloroflexota bacterium]
MNPKPTTVVGVFESRDAAERAVDALRQAGFRPDQIGFAMRGGGDVPAGTVDTIEGSNAGAGAATGAILGGLLGAAAALLIPGIGPVLALGTLGGSVLTGAVAGGTLGALAGALIGVGIPEEEARYYEGEFASGRAIVTVKAESRVGEAEQIMRRFGAYDVNSRQPVDSTRGGAHEHLHGHAGGTEMHSHSHVHPAGQPEQHDHSHAAAGMASAVVREEVGAEAPRREEAVINRAGDVPMAGQDWNSYMPTFRQHWQTTYGSRGHWEEYEPMYRYGFDQFNSGRWSGRSWSDVEPEFRRDWSTRYPNQSWDVASNPIKHAWDHLTATLHTHTR